MRFSRIRLSFKRAHAFAHERFALRLGMPCRLKLPDISRVVRLTPISVPLLLPASPLNQGPFPPPALPGFSGNMGLSDFPPSPPLPSRVVGCVALRPRSGWDLPCCYRTPIANMPSPMPRWTRTAFLSLAYCPVAAFPMFQLGRHPHQMVSGLAQCSFTLRPACSLTRFFRAFGTKGFGLFIASCSPRLLPAGA
jgi:hypothetical protein